MMTMYILQNYVKLEGEDFGVSLPVVRVLSRRIRSFRYSPLPMQEDFSTERVHDLSRSETDAGTAGTDTAMEREFGMRPGPAPNAAWRQFLNAGRSDGAAIDVIGCIGLAAAGCPSLIISREFLRCGQEKRRFCFIGFYWTTSTGLTVTVNWGPGALDVPGPTGAGTWSNASQLPQLGSFSLRRSSELSASLSHGMDFKTFEP